MMTKTPEQLTHMLLLIQFIHWYMYVFESLSKLLLQSLFRVLLISCSDMSPPPHGQPCHYEMNWSSPNVSTSFNLNLENIIYKMHPKYLLIYNSALDFLLLLFVFL